MEEIRTDIDSDRARSLILEEKSKKLTGMKALPKHERPYERLYYKGASFLSNQEILSIIIGSGSKDMNALETASLILSRFASDGMASLQGVSVEELMQIKGIGMYKAIRIKAAFELVNRCMVKPRPKNLNCSSPQNIVKYYQYYMESLEREELKALFLNTKNILIRDKVISIGGLNSTIVYPRDVFREAIRANSAAIILMHNHPSGNINPSEDDLITTKKFYEAGKIIGVRLHDHIIFGKVKFMSLASEKYYKYLFN